MPYLGDMAAEERSTFTPAQRRTLADSADREGPIACPACGAAMARHGVPAKRELPYVRRRLLLICPSCRRSATVDVKRDA